MTGSRVIATGHYQPERVLTNAELEELVATSDDWIRSRVGIAERRIAAPDEGVAEMAVEAARNALNASGLAPEDIDMVVAASCTSHDRSPNVAARVADALKMPSHPAVLDINVACAGFTHALAITDHAIAVGSVKHAMVIGVEKLSDFTDWTDRTTCVLVGDGAGAVVVSASETSGVSPVLWGSVPEMSDAVRITGKDGSFSQNGQSVFRWTTTQLPKIAREVCARAGVKPEDLGAVVLHQANKRIIVPLAERLGATNAVVSLDVVNSGNTSAASIPIALSKLVDDGSVEKGAPVLLFGFGGGLAYAGQVIACP